MRIKTPRTSPKEEKRGGSEYSGITKPVPLEPPKKVRVEKRLEGLKKQLEEEVHELQSTKELTAAEKADIKRKRLELGLADERLREVHLKTRKDDKRQPGFNDTRKDGTRYRWPKGKPAKKRTMKRAPGYETTAHTIWIRDDIWAAVKVFSQKENRSLRSTVEESLYEFLLKQGRVTEVETIGDTPEESSWKL